MPRTTTSTADPIVRPRRRRHARRLNPSGVVPTEQTAAAMDDVAEAEALFDDVLALLGAGLITAAAQQATVRYAAVDEHESSDRQTSRGTAASHRSFSRSG